MDKQQNPLEEDQKLTQQAEELEGMVQEIAADLNSVHEYLEDAFVHIQSLTKNEQDKRKAALSQLLKGYSTDMCSISRDNTGWGFRVESTENNPIDYSYCVETESVSRLSK